ncbi:hypothetical protein [Rhodoferax sp.]|uniref:hypothetical protein n=1 Tax=Rhodoferax sp. TaxID=50421 RepID=UPI002771817E|nr:hypothetical protein [Rhodoferax sp.]
MAPDLALDKTRKLAKGALVLDPMAGSGTVLRAASQTGHRCIGLDVDPLAVLMTKVATSKIDEVRFVTLLDRLLDQAPKVDLRSATIPWFDRETSNFIGYWFAPPQRQALTRLAYLLSTRRSLSDDSPEANALRLTLSRLIITKERGASLGRDVSHSRPHRTADETDFDVFEEFPKAAERLRRRIPERARGIRPTVRLGDARTLRWIRNQSIDMIMTSPPYLNAIDYMRGHRLSLVWLGYNLSELRSIRSNSIGAERSVDPHTVLSQVKTIKSKFGKINELPLRHQGMIERYCVDLILMTKQAARVLKPRGRAVFVVGNSCLKDVFVSNARALIAAASLADLELLQKHERALPTASRYLPTPDDNNSALGRRMRTESVLTFAHKKGAR